MERVVDNFGALLFITYIRNVKNVYFQNQISDIPNNLGIAANFGNVFLVLAPKKKSYNSQNYTT